MSKARAATERRFFTNKRTFVEPVQLSRTGTALVIIDMQYHDASVDQGFNLGWERIEPGSMAYFNERNENVVIPTIARLIDYFRSHGMKVVYLTLGSEYRDYRDLPDRLRRWIRRLEEETGIEDIYWTGNPSWAIRKEIAPAAGDTIIGKTTWGAFNSTTIDQTLRAMGVETLVITGVSTNCCVESTARDAADRGYGCVIVDKGTADYDQESHDAALAGFYFNFGRVVDSAEDVIAALETETVI